MALACWALAAPAAEAQTPAKTPPVAARPARQAKAPILPIPKPPAPAEKSPTTPALTTAADAEPAPERTVTGPNGKPLILPQEKPPVPEPTVAAARERAPGFRARTAPRSLAARDRDVLVRALSAAESGRRDQALDIVAPLGNSAFSALVEWAAMRRAGPTLGFGARSAFLKSHPGWPARLELIRAAEDEAVHSDDAAGVVAWFSENAPTSTSGRVAFARALLKVGRTEEARKLARETWVTARFERQEEREFLKDFERDLTMDDHRARLQDMLYGERRAEADRFLRRVDNDTASIAKVRIALMGGAGNVERMIAQLPEKLRNDPGLVYDRIKWRRKRDREESAREILPRVPDTYPRLDLWWRERQLLAMDSIEKKRYQEAYDIIINQRATDAPSVADAEWMAGWLALRFLNKGEAALVHFQKVYDTVQIGANTSRAAYWVGRAAEHLGRPDIAADWYRRAATHITTFYGQLAIGKLKDPVLPTLPADPVPTAEERSAFEANEMTRAVRALSELPGTPYLRQFLLALAESSDFAVGRVMAAELADDLGRPDYSVWIARQAARDRIVVLEHGYPIPPFTFPQTPEKPLVLGVMRQESNFDPAAESSAGAVGLMQLMPATARAVGNQLGLRYNKAALSEDPSYNIRLGTTYLRSLVHDFDGSYLMAIAGYNAGPGRAVQWARTFGDPRAPGTDVVDWVEQIPFSETRAYVQRVLENMMIYRAILADKKDMGQDLEQVLRQGG